MFKGAAMLHSDAVGTAKRARQEPQPSKLRNERVRQGLSREFVARSAKIHPNTLKLLENGTIRDTSAEVADALARVLKTSSEDLGLSIRRTATSIRLRELSPEKRAILNDILDLPEEKYAELRAALTRIRGKGRKA